MGYSWQVDETYVKIRRKWAYLYRVIDNCGHTIDLYLSPIRNAQAAKRFLGKALKSIKSWLYPSTINTDKASAYSAAITELKAEGKCPPDILHRQVKYLNNMIEADYGKIKPLINPVRGFKSMKMAYATIKGFELMRMFKKGQMEAWKYGRNLIGEIRSLRENRYLRHIIKILKTYSGECYYLQQSHIYHAYCVSTMARI